MKKKTIGKILNQNKYYLMMVTPAVILIIVFCYVPMYGVLIAFQDYLIGNSFLAGPWVGLKHFFDYYKSMFFARTFLNTMILGIYSIVFAFPFPIIFALFINEVKNRHIKKIIQTTSYFPHFISTVVIVGMLKQFLDLNTGVVNNALELLGLNTINFFSDSSWFRSLYIGSGIWAGFGWASIIYLSALTSVDMEMYEAADIDGATRFQKMLKITLPSIVPTMVIMLIMNIGQIMSTSLEKVLLMYNEATWDVSDIIQTYQYRKGILQQSYSSGAAIGLFSSVTNIILLVIANFISRHVSETSLW